MFQKQRIFHTDTKKPPFRLQTTGSGPKRFPAPPLKRVITHSRYALVACGLKALQLLTQRDLNTALLSKISKLPESIGTNLRGRCHVRDLDGSQDQYKAQFRFHAFCAYGQCISWFSEGTKELCWTFSQPRVQFNIKRKKLLL